MFRFQDTMAKNIENVRQHMQSYLGQLQQQNQRPMFTYEEVCTICPTILGNQYIVFTTDSDAHCRVYVTKSYRRSSLTGKFSYKALVDIKLLI